MTQPFRVDVFSAKPYDETFLSEAAKAAGVALGAQEHIPGGQLEIVFHPVHLSARTAELALGAGAVCAFVNDDLSSDVLEALSALDVKLIALRCAGFNHVDLECARKLDLPICRVPAYSPHAVAEHTVALMMTLNRSTHRAFNRVREGNFALDGLMGFDLHGKTVGIVGTGLIGQVLARIMTGFGCKILAFDPVPNEECEALGVDYVSFNALIEQADIISLQCPLTHKTRHLIDEAAINRMKPGVMLINTSRGAVIDTSAVVRGLKSGQIGALGLDVYEEESELFFEDLSNEIIPDDLFARLLTFPNVIVTGHQGFFTSEALRAIADVTIKNITDYLENGAPTYPVS
ncbi:MAG: 2-hydroxyacid dehydrogenase [Rhodobacteraceae bacterium]|nr:2-hydroxyacid dehydrogenase [Paracoccaceae bacterium]